ncbi:MAG: hypothetical protein IPI01_03795 [Ignavibacteriae bacterium]|nr:hypothetical protein [Ignavibacteriota bacterium]
MCYSAGASFIGGAVISAIGVATVKEVRKPSQIAFASIPLFFGLQQITEGFLWLALTDPAYAHVERAGTYGFLLMARIVWPTMLPLSVVLMEEGGGNRRLQFILLGMGLSVSVYYTYCLAFLNVVPNIAGHHIQYISDFPESLAVPVFIVYFIAVITPLFIAKNRRTRLLGVLMFLSCLVTAVLFFQYLTSVWCFFAAIISVVVYWILKEPHSATGPVPVPGS